MRVPWAGGGLLRMGCHLDDAGSGVLAAHAVAAPPQREKHRVRGHRRVPDEGRFLARIEETHAKIVVRCVGREDEGRLGVRELARDGEQSGVALAVRVEYDGGGVAGEACGRKCVYLKNAQGCLRSLL